MLSSWSAVCWLSGKFDLFPLHVIPYLEARPFHSDVQKHSKIWWRIRNNCEEHTRCPMRLHPCVFFARQRLVSALPFTSTQPDSRNCETRASTSCWQCRDLQWNTRRIGMPFHQYIHVFYLFQPSSTFFNLLLPSSTLFNLLQPSSPFFYLGVTRNYWNCPSF